MFEITVRKKESAPVFRSSASIHEQPTEITSSHASAWVYMNFAPIRVRSQDTATTKVPKVKASAGAYFANRQLLSPKGLSSMTLWSVDHFFFLEAALRSMDYFFLNDANRWNHQTKHMFGLRRLSPLDVFLFLCY